MARMRGCWASGCLAVAMVTAGAALAQDFVVPEQQKCLEEFTGHRVEVEKLAKVTVAESKLRPTRERLCELVSVYANTELKWLEFA
jgi:hypothetical protein